MPPLPNTTTNKSCLNALPARSHPCCCPWPQLEAAHRVLDLYAWLAFRLPEAFLGSEEVAERRAALCALIDASIRDMGAAPRRRTQGRAASDTSASADVSLRLPSEEDKGEQEQIKRRDSYRKHAWR